MVVKMKKESGVRAYELKKIIKDIETCEDRLENIDSISKVRIEKKLSELKIKRDELSDQLANNGEMSEVIKMNYAIQLLFKINQNRSSNL